MINSIRLSQEAEALLNEIINHEKDTNYWEVRFDNIDNRTKAILFKSFSELKYHSCIAFSWADDMPSDIIVLEDGYSYVERMKGFKMTGMSEFEKKIQALLRRANEISDMIHYSYRKMDQEGFEYQRDLWVNDFELFYHKYLTDHPFSQRIETILFHRNKDAFKDLFAILVSISNDTDYIDSKNGVEKTMVPKYQKKIIPEYDVFISHANVDKAEFVDDLKSSLDKLGVQIFYDKDTLEWGDNWKERILNGVEKSEFAIIIISENFFGREWTENELKELLSRQNRNGQKIILPILHKITIQQLLEKYPAVADIQAIDSSKYSVDEIAILFAKQLIKRLKA